MGTALLDETLWFPFEVVCVITFCFVIMSIVPLLLACIFFKAIVGFSANLFALIVPSSLVMMS